MIPKWNTDFVQPWKTEDGFKSQDAWEENMKKTVFVLLDACQYEAGTRNLGYLEHMVDAGQAAKYKVKGELPSLSRPMYATLLTGLPVSRHGITCNEMARTLNCDSVFSMCKAEGGVTAAAAYHWVSELYNAAPFRIPEDRIWLHSGKNIDHGIYYWEDMYPDSHVLSDGEFLRKVYDPDFLMIHTMNIDHKGHQYGCGSQQYEWAVSTVGCLLSQFIPVWLESGCHVVVTADHGMNGYGIHGGTDSPQRDTPLYIFSDLVETGRHEDIYISQLCVAPLLVRLMGLHPSKTMMDMDHFPILFL